MRSTVIQLFAALGAAAGCARSARGVDEPPRPAAPASSRGAAPPRSVFAARPLDGPFASIEAWCAHAADEEGWGTGARCQPDEPGTRAAAWGSVHARVVSVEYTVVGSARQSTCRVAITTPRGTWVEAVDDKCQGLIGPATLIATRFEDFGWVDGQLRIRAHVTRTEGVDPWPSKRRGPVDFESTTEWFEVCALDADGGPRCTPHVLIGCSDALGTPHALGVALEGGVLALRVLDASEPRPSCWVGTGPVAGDFVVF